MAEQTLDEMIASLMEQLRQTRRVLVIQAFSVWVFARSRLGRAGLPGEVEGVTSTKESAMNNAETHSLEEAARRLGIGRGLAYDLARRGEFPVPIIRLGRRIVVPRRALDRLLGIREAEPDPADPEPDPEPVIDPCDPGNIDFDELAKVAVEGARAAVQAGTATENDLFAVANYGD